MKRHFRISAVVIAALFLFLRLAKAVDETGLYVAPSDPTPPMPGIEHNPPSPEKIELGRVLFFDRILSRTHAMACATCHLPDYGFGDGRATSMGGGAKGLGPDRSGGAVLPRNAPTLWNTGFHNVQFWDGRAITLEEQADIVMRDRREMSNNPENVVKELREIGGYGPLFAAAFGGDEGESITYEHVLKALAAFQRTLISVDSPYDQYQAGDENALTESQKRGMNSFFSESWNCGTCHPVPLFRTNEFVVTGVPQTGAVDEGRRAITGEGPAGAFKVPSLRNIALTAPYMHNGAFATLEEVIRFYAGGGGHDHPDIDPRVRAFEFTEQEFQDVIEFLHALTDTSQTPAVPDEVPSGLPVPQVHSK